MFNSKTAITILSLLANCPIFPCELPCSQYMLVQYAIQPSILFNSEGTIPKPSMDWFVGENLHRKPSIFPMKYAFFSVISPPNKPIPGWWFGTSVL